MLQLILFTVGIADTTKKYESLLRALVRSAKAFPASE